MSALAIQLNASQLIIPLTTFPCLPNSSAAPEVLIVNEQGGPLSEKFYNLDSLLELNCVVNHIAMTTSVVHWHHNNVSLNYDATRGGIR